MWNLVFRTRGPVEFREAPEGEVLIREGIRALRQADHTMWSPARLWSNPWSSLLDWDLQPDEPPEPPSKSVSFLKVGLGALFGIPATLNILMLLKTVLKARYRIYDYLIGSPSNVDDDTQSMFRSALNTFDPSSVEWSKKKARKTNASHSSAAGVRAAATTFSEVVAAQTGYEPFCFQMSRRDAKSGFKGSRTYYHAKDTQMNLEDNPIGPRHLVTMIDVDYYVDMVKHLSENPVPHFLFTVIPTRAGQQCEDYTYRFNSSNELVMEIAGGATYTHKLWNWNRDSFVTQYGAKAVLWDCQTRQIAPDRSIVMLIPLRVFYGVSAYVVGMWGPHLTRLEPVSGEFVKLRVRTSTGSFVSLARVQSVASATITAPEFDQLRSYRMITAKSALQLWQVKAVTQASGTKLDDARASIVVDFFNNARDLMTDVAINLVEPVPMKILAFDFPDPSNKTNMEAFMKPIIEPGYVFLNNANADAACVMGRVIEPKQVDLVFGQFTMTATKTRAFYHFIHQLVPEDKRWKLDPSSFDEVEAKQLKPSQKRDVSKANESAPFLERILDAAAAGLHHVGVMKKAEVYGKPTDPRNITTFPAPTRIEYAAFMYPIMDYVAANCPNYAFGRSPKSIAEHLASIAKKAKRNIVCPDISRMDGHVNSLCRALELSIAYRLFPPEVHSRFKRAHAAHFGATGHTEHDQEYEQGFGRGSGEMGTSVWNTIICMFIIYLSFIYAGCTHEEAWDRMIAETMEGGDDSFVIDHDPAQIVRAGRDCGFVITYDEYQRGDPGVNFLARVYSPDVWNGSPHSCCDLRRQLQKFHLTPRVPLSPEDKLIEKAISFALTDRNTPVIGDLVTRVLELRPGAQTTGTLARFFDKYELMEQYPNENTGGWMDAYLHSLDLHFDSESFRQYLPKARHITDLLALPVFFEETAVPDAAVKQGWEQHGNMLINRTRNIILPPVKRLKEEKRVEAGDGLGLGDLAENAKEPLRAAEAVAVAGQTAPPNPAGASAGASKGDRKQGGRRAHKSD